MGDKVLNRHLPVMHRRQRGCMTLPNSDTRRRRLDTLATSDGELLRRLWAGVEEPVHEVLRGPETGLVALRGRIGGGGAPFHFSEATVSRASVRLENGATGHAIALGRDTGKVRIAALLDAMAQDDASGEWLERTVIEPLRADREERDRIARAQAAATKVDFFTLVRGED